MIDLLLLDGNGAAFRHHIVAEAKFRQPVPERDYSVPAVVSYGLLNLLTRAIDQHDPARVVVCWDSSRSWRRRLEIYSQYKQSRREDKTPEQQIVQQHYRHQIRSAQALLWTLGIDQAAGPDLEADDLIAWYCWRARTCCILSGDKDMRLLVRPGVTVQDPFRLTCCTVQNFREVAGVERERYLEYLALVGDKCDNVPGVPGVGPVTAQRWLDRFGTADEIARHETRPKGALQALRASLAAGEVERNRRLIDLTWVRALPSVPERSGQLDLERAGAICSRMAMHKVVAQWPQYESCFYSAWLRRRQWTEQNAAAAGQNAAAAGC